MMDEKSLDMEKFELIHFHQAAYEGDTKHALKAIHNLAELRNVTEFQVLMVLDLTFSKNPRVKKFVDFLIDNSLEEE
ncbi:MAG: hypothetical protein ACI4T3_04310 [Lactobacillus sp.]